MLKIFKNQQEKKKHFRTLKIRFSKTEQHHIAPAVRIDQT